LGLSAGSDGLQLREGAEAWHGEHGVCSVRRRMSVGEIALVDRSRPVASLDALHAQAAAMQGVLLRKVQQWALHSGGSFFLAKTQEGGAQQLGLWAQLVERYGEEAGNHVQWARPKTADRALEKLVRAYRGDASRLVDMSRQSICFASLDGVLSCLNAVRADPDAVVVRVKNKLTTEYKSARTAGYRDCAFNVRIDCEETRRLGVEGHVCEVLLLLSSFAALKHDEGHARYVTWRNARAE